MTYHTETARLVFVDGPLALYVQQAKPEEISAAYVRLGRLLAVATAHLKEEAERASKSVRSLPSSLNDRRRSSGGE